MGAISFSGNVSSRDGTFEAVVELLDLRASGASAEEAQENLIEQFINWIRECENRGTLEEKLAEAGYKGVNDGTELVLEFTEAP